jgi:hypothetical protein
VTRDDVEAAIRAWARRSPLLPVGFTDSMKVRRVREGEIRRAVDHIAVDVGPIGVPGPEDYKTTLTHYDPEPGAAGGLPASVLRDAGGRTVHTYERVGPEAGGAPDPFAAPATFHYLVRVVAERLRWRLESEGRPHQIAGRTLVLESIPVTYATVEYRDRDYEFAFVGTERRLHVPEMPRAWVRIALMAGLVVTGLTLLLGRLVIPAVEARVMPAVAPVSAPARIETPSTVLCPVCLGRSAACSACRTTGRITVETKVCRACGGLGTDGYGSTRRVCRECSGSGKRK